MCEERWSEELETWVTDKCSDPDHAHSSTHSGAAQNRKAAEAVKKMRKK